MKDEREVEKIAMNVLQDEREGAFSEIGLTRLADGAGRRVGPEGFVVSAAIVVAGETESAGRPEDQHGGRDRRRAARRVGAEPGLGRAEEFGRIERREVGAEADSGRPAMPPRSSKR